MEDIFTQLISAYISQVESALHISEILSEHAGEETISPDNIILGLIYRLMVPMTEKEMKESVDFTKKIMEDDSSSDEDDEGEDDEGGDEEYLIDESKKTSRKIKTNHCNCDICMKARVCLLNYPNYEAEDIFAEKFHNSIKHTCEKHKLIL